MQNEGQDPLEESETYWKYLFYNGDEYYRVIVISKKISAKTQFQTAKNPKDQKTKWEQGKGLRADAANIVRSRLISVIRGPIALSDVPRIVGSIRVRRGRPVSIGSIT